MNMKRLSRQTCRFLQPPGVISCAAVAGRLEGAGPLGGHFDAVAEDSFCGRKTWEQGEAQMQADALRLALQKGGLTAEDVDCVFAYDLLNQNIGATFALRDFHIPFYGVYGACSTMGETLALAATAIAAEQRRHRRGADVLPLLHRRAAVPLAPALRQPAQPHRPVDSHRRRMLHSGCPVGGGPISPISPGGRSWTWA